VGKWHFGEPSNPYKRGKMDVETMMMMMMMMVVVTDGNQAQSSHDLSACLSPNLLACFYAPPWFSKNKSRFLPLQALI